MKGEGGPVSFRGCEGGRGASQLWSCVVLFCGEWRRVSFRGAKGGESALELGVKLKLFVVVAVVVVAVLSVFVLGGRGASQLWSCVVLFCGEWRRVSFRGAKGGESALELGVKLFVVAVVAVCFCFGRAEGQSALELGVKLFVAVAVVVLSVFVLGAGGGPVSFRDCEGGRGASQLWSLV